MTVSIDEAIQDLKDILNPKKPLDKGKDYKPSIRFGVEALDAIRRTRSEGKYISSVYRLPSESKG